MQSAHRRSKAPTLEKETVMNAQSHHNIVLVDTHSALARAHADRAEYIRLAMASVPVLFKRLAARLHANRLPHGGTRA
jgi:hypothetical protein